MHLTSAYHSVFIDYESERADVTCDDGYINKESFKLTVKYFDRKIYNWPRDLEGG